MGGTSVAPLTEFDRILVDGTAALGGTLEVRLINGFSPSVGDDIDMILGAINGIFDAVSGLTLGDGVMSRLLL